jgi:hypothetical protein
MSAATPLSFVALALLADAPEAPALPSHPENEGIERFIVGNVSAALSAEDACARGGSDSCRTAALVMRDILSIARRAPALSPDDLEKLGALDRRISPHQWSAPRLGAAQATADTRCAVAVKARKEGDLAKACEAAQFALDAFKDNPCARRLLKEMNATARQAVLEYIDARRHSENDGGLHDPPPADPKLPRSCYWEGDTVRPELLDQPTLPQPRPIDR